MLQYLSLTALLACAHLVSSLNPNTILSSPVPCPFSPCSGSRNPVARRREMTVAPRFRIRSVVSVPARPVSFRLEVSKSMDGLGVWSEGRRAEMDGAERVEMGVDKGISSISLFSDRTSTPDRLVLVLIFDTWVDRYARVVHPYLSCVYTPGEVDGRSMIESE